LTRFFRFYEKKRGHRRTGSGKLGNAGEALFFAVILLAGCVGLATLVIMRVIPEWRVNHQFVEHECVVLKRGIGEIQGSDGPLYRPEIKIQYQVHGETYCETTYDIHSAYSSGREEKQEIANRFTEGRSYPCWYDPADPRTAVLVRGYTWWIWLAFIVPLSFVAIGGGGLIYAIVHWGTSAERRAALARRAQQYAPFDEDPSSASQYPRVPNGSGITDSPGTRLRFRLPVARSPAWAVLGLLVAAVLWNGTVSVFAVVAVSGLLEGDPDWFLTLFTLPFALVGMGLIALLVRQLLVTTGIGPTLVEISDHPLRPGGRYALFLSQAGRLAMKSLRVLLVCEEEASYRQGTNSRRETCQVQRQVIFSREGFAVRSGMPFEVECDLPVPVGAMHSFKADHNEIQWKLVVEGEASGWPAFSRSFAVVVRPAASSTTEPGAERETRAVPRP